jgi:hypothetical protein
MTNVENRVVDRVQDKTLSTVKSHVESLFRDRAYINFMRGVSFDAWAHVMARVTHNVEHNIKHNLKNDLKNSVKDSLENPQKIPRSTMNSALKSIEEAS